MVRLGASCSSDINNMTPIEVVWMTCLCGCDYINNLHGCGMAKALQTVQSWRGKSPEVLSAVRYHPSLTHTLNQTATLLTSDLTTTPAFGSLAVPTGIPQGDGTCWKVESGQKRTANQDLFRSHSNGATGFVDWFNMTVTAFMTHRVS